MAHDALITIAVALFAGVALVVIAYHLRIPAIVPLLVVGFLLGPNGIGVINTASLTADGLKMIISLSIAVILFEGGLSLKPDGFKKAGKVIRNMLSIGVLITWFGVATIVYLVFDLSLSISLLAGSLVIVTGPTVVTPLIRRIGVNEKLQQILSWEAILIDPIGVFIALFCFEWVVADPTEISRLLGIGVDAGIAPFIVFTVRILAGSLIGLLGGVLLDRMLRSAIIPVELMNMTVLSIAILIFAVCDVIAHETGLLAVTIAGYWLGLKSPPHLKQIKRFKLELTDISIGLLFMLLAANLDLDAFLALGTDGIIAVGCVLFLVRPLAVFVSTRGSNLIRNEKLFLSWVAPRGIVAASMASIIALYLTNKNVANAGFVEAFTYAIIGATVIIQGFSASKIAKLLNVKSEDRDGWLIVGVHSFSIAVADFLRDTGRSVTFIDTDPLQVAEVQRRGYIAVAADPVILEDIDQMYFARIGNVIAFTDHKETNLMICQAWNEIVTRHHLYRWQPGFVKDKAESIGNIIFSDLPKPTIIADELDSGQATIHTWQVTAESLPKLPKTSNYATLIQLGKSKIHFHQGLSLDRSFGSHCVIERNQVYLMRVIQDDLIRRIPAVDMGDLLTQGMQILSKHIPTIPYEQTLTDLLNREEMTPTLIGNGVAIPHAYCEKLKESVCMMIHVDPGMHVNTASGDEMPVDLAFLLLSPPHNPKMHLQLLSDIARLVTTTNLVNMRHDIHTKSDLISITESVIES